MEKLNASLNPISKIATNQNIDKNIQEAAKCLMSHLPNLKRTYEAISLTNADKISKATEGTMTIPTRSLTAMIDTLPPFSGLDNPDTVSWLEFQIAMDQLKGLHNFDKSDIVMQVLNKIQEPAKLLIASNDKQKTVKDIFEKLKSVYGNPKQVLSRVIQDHNRIGAIPEAGMSKIFQILSQHQDLLDKTNTYLNSFQTADQEETTMVLRQNAYDLYSNDNSMMNSAEKVFITKRNKVMVIQTGTRNKSRIHQKVQKQYSLRQSHLKIKKTTKKSTIMKKISLVGFVNK